LCAGIIALIQDLALVVIFWGYVFFVLAQTAWARARHHEPIVVSH
jgi:hypothetical protein